MSKKVLLFPGQGSQLPAMGKELATQHAHCMKLWEQAEEYSKLPLRSIYWEDCTEEKMMKTDSLQPALTAFAIALCSIYQQRSSYHATAGHSLGEFAALYAAGVLSAEEALFLTTERGRLMNLADPHGDGSMVAVVKLELPVIESIVHDIQEQYGPVLFIANYNTPRQFILSGKKEFFTQLTEKVTSHKGRMITFPIAGAFHSPLMNGAQEQFLPFLEQVQWKKPHCPFYSTVTTTPLTDPIAIKEAIAVQIVSPVQFINTLYAMQADSITHYVELCADPTCTPLVKATLGKDVQLEAISS